MQERKDKLKPYEPEIMGQMGEDIYQQDIRRQVEPHHNGSVVAIDVDTRQWALGADQDEAVAELRKASPQAFNILCRGAGEPAVYRMRKSSTGCGN